MENTQVTTRTKAICAIFACYGVLLLACAGVNLLGTFTSIARLNETIDERMHAAAKLPDAEKTAEMNKLLIMQEQSLRFRPSEPFAWARLSYLRTSAGKGNAEAFAALRMSDYVSPYEAQQLPERAVAWMRYVDVESKDEQAYIDTLWQKAFTVAEKSTWDLAMQMGLTKYVLASLTRKDKKLADGWRGRMAEAGMPTN